MDEDFEKCAKENCDNKRCNFNTPSSSGSICWQCNNDDNEKEWIRRDEEDRDEDEQLYGSIQGFTYINIYIYNIYISIHIFIYTI